MARRGVIATLLVIIAVQLAGGVLFATVCLEPCADDGPGQTCPPVCTSCTHAQQAVVQATMTAAALAVTPHVFPARHSSAPPRRAADIFHVPLLG